MGWVPRPGLVVKLTGGRTAGSCSAAQMQMQPRGGRLPRTAACGNRAPTSLRPRRKHDVMKVVFFKDRPSERRRSSVTSHQVAAAVGVAGRRGVALYSRKVRLFTWRSCTFLPVLRVRCAERQYQEVLRLFWGG